MTKNISASMCLICEDSVGPNFGRKNNGNKGKVLHTLFLRPCPQLTSKMFGYNLDSFLKGAIERTGTTTVGDHRIKVENHCCDVTIGMLFKVSNLRNSCYIYTCYIHVDI